jgi:Zn-dependent protease
VDFSPAQIRQIVVGLFVLLVSVALHEFGHAVVAYKLGDDTPKRQGRVTLNPLAHADPIGTFLLPLMGSIFAAAGGGVGGFGWGKPVQWNPARIRRGISMNTAAILVSIAGPGMNLILGMVIALVHVILLSQNVVSLHGPTSDAIVFAAGTNFVLMFFNLVPVPPLDGGHATQALIPYKYRAQYENVMKFGPFIILAIMMIPAFRNIFLTPAIWCLKSAYNGFGSLFGVGPLFA